MNVLFLHNNFPAQFRSLAVELAQDPAHRVVAIGCQTAQPMANVDLRRYQMANFDVSATHPFARRFDHECRRATLVLYALTQLRAEGFTPDLILGHCGWGETLPLRALFPKAKIGIYCEYYYRAEGQDLHFDPEGPQLGVDGLVALHCKNASTLLSLAEADFGLSPTQWQKQTYPPEFHAKIHVIHEGVDIARLGPDPNARFLLPNGDRLDRSRDVVTFFARDLEPMRGYHIFMRAAPLILAANPQAQIVVVGGDGVSYGAAPPEGRSWKKIYFDEVADRLDLSRIHLLPRLPYDDYLRLLQLSRAHVYLTYPFVLSWSLIEAMAVGCAIIASDTAPVREVIADGENGRLTPFFDPPALARNVSRLLADREAQAALGAAARQTARTRYAQQDSLDQVMDLIGLPRAASSVAPSAPARSPRIFRQNRD